MTSKTSIILSVSPSRPQDTAIILKSDSEQETILTNYDLLQARNKGRINLRGAWVRVSSSYLNAPSSTINKIPILSLLSLSLPSATLIGAIYAFLISDDDGWEAVFPSISTTSIVSKLAVWGTLLTIVAYENAFFWYGSSLDKGITAPVGLEVEIENSTLHSSESISQLQSRLLMSSSQALDNSSPSKDSNRNSNMDSSSLSQSPNSNKSNKQSRNNSIGSSSPNRSRSSIQNNEQTVPFRFIRATKMDFAAAKIRWSNTLKWRKEWGMDTILQEPHPNFNVIKSNYPHYFHLRGKNNECCYYECPPKMNLEALKLAGIGLEDLLRHYALCCEYMWSEIEPSEEGKSIYIIDLEGIGLRDFVGEVVDFVKKATAFTGEHYPERSGGIYLINVPSWFNIIWSAVKPLVDDVTKKKITIMKAGPEAILKALEEKIPIENIPPEYGGKSMPLGQSPEEIQFAEHFAKLNNNATGTAVVAAESESQQ